MHYPASKLLQMKIMFVLLSTGAFALHPIMHSFDFSNASKKDPCRSKERSLQYQQQGQGRRLAAVDFKAQDYCRAEMPPDFNFDVKFTVVSATVYFTGAGFPDVETGYISSNSLKPVKPMMDKCKPGSIVIFDNIKVKGPGEELRIIESVSMRLY